MSDSRFNPNSPGQLAITDYIRALLGAIETHCTFSLPPLIHASYLKINHTFA